MMRVLSTVSAMPLKDVCKIAHTIFQWNPDLIRVLTDIIRAAKVPTELDLGVHIRGGDKITTGESRAIPITDYIKAIKKFQATTKKDNLTIFVMTDSMSQLAELKKKADPSWTLFNMAPSLPQPDGHVQDQFNRSPPRARLSAYHSFMAELLIMQSISDILCTFSSNVGRFLYFTVEHPERIVSLDEPKMTIK